MRYLPSFSLVFVTLALMLSVTPVHQAVAGKCCEYKNSPRQNPNSGCVDIGMATNSFQCINNLKGKVIANRQCSTKTYDCDKVQTSSCFCSGMMVASDVASFRSAMEGRLEKPVTLKFSVTTTCNTVPPFRVMAEFFKAADIRSEMTGTVVLTFAPGEGEDSRYDQTVIRDYELSASTLQFPLLEGGILPVEIKGMDVQGQELWYDREDGTITGWADIEQQTTLGTMVGRVDVIGRVDVTNGTILIEQSGGDYKFRF